ncbi:MAG: hypothetical protein J3R72DRAFT_154188 [Linnemannia gamsii]|nr:MAG: hypothetical protein J3R72DRAFT_154188 [Linnemannia gamsii]
MRTIVCGHFLSFCLLCCLLIVQKGSGHMIICLLCWQKGKTGGGKRRRATESEDVRVCTWCAWCCIFEKMGLERRKGTKERKKYMYIHAYIYSCPLVYRCCTRMDYVVRERIDCPTDSNSKSEIDNM